MKLLGPFVPRGRSIRFYLLLSWVIPGLFVFCASTFVYFLFSWLEHTNRIAVVQDQLIEKSVTVARRLSGEMLIGPRGSPGAISKFLEKELALKNVSFSSAQPPCSLTPNSNGDYCVHRNENLIQVFRKIPFLGENYYSSSELEAPVFSSSVRPTILLWSMMPLLLLIGLGIFIQRRFLRDHVSDPIKSLVETTTGDAEPNALWPREFREIAEQLSQSFKEREEAVFGKLSRGVIHDIRTLLHTVLSATDLVKESEENSTLKEKRLQVLYKACQINLKKVRNIVDLTLDGSREIPIRKVNANLINTLSGAIANNQSLAAAKGVSIVFDSKDAKEEIAHDPVQCERVFTNLIKNGIEAFDDANSKSTSHSKIVSVSLVKNDHHKISISIEDSGPGLRVDGENAFQLLKSSKIHGSGLGLLVSKKIIEGHGGKINASKSSNLKGAKFEIILSEEVGSEMSL